MATLYQNIWSVNDYVYHTTTSGINVYNNKVFDYRIPLNTPATAVWANENYIYMGTLTSGVYVASISGSAAPYKQEPDITSNNTVYLHGAGDYLCVTTTAGADRYTLSSGTRISKLNNYLHKCYQTSTGDFYYIENTRFYNIDPNDLGGSVQDWSYYQYITFTTTTIDNSQVYVDFPYDFPFIYCQPDGRDLRFVRDDGTVLSYYIESWYPDARVVVKLPTAGSNNFYMLYGNDQASSQSDPYSAYYLYDHFEGTSLDTDKWVAITKGDGSITVANSIVTIRDNDNDSCEIISQEKVPYGYTEARIRYNGGSAITDFDGSYGYSLLNTGAAFRGNVKIDPTHNPGYPSYEQAHYLDSYWGGNVQGAALITEGFRVWKFIFTDGFQSSTFAEETLTTTASGIGSENYLIFQIHNGSSTPDLQIDYVKHSTYPINETTTSTHQELWPLIKPSLHAVYDRDTDWVFPNYTYNIFYTNPNLLNDIYVTEGTSTLSGSNVIFIGTDTSAVVMEEHQSDELNAKIKYFLRG